MDDNTKPEADSGKCYFLDISGELRNRIYRYAVIDTDPIRVLNPTESEDITTGLQPPPSEPALASTNKQIRGEVIAIYWSENEFEVAQVYRGGALNPDYSTGIIFDAGFQSAHATSGIEKWIELLGHRAKLLRRLTAKSISKAESITASAALNEKTGLVSISVQHRAPANFGDRHSSIEDGAPDKVSDVCACRLNPAVTDTVDTVLDGLRLVNIMKKFCEMYFDHKIFQIFTPDGVGRPQRCAACSHLRTQGGQCARRGGWRGRSSRGR